MEGGSEEQAQSQLHDLKGRCAVHSDLHKSWPLSTLLYKLGRVVKYQHTDLRAHCAQSPGIKA